MNQKSLTKALLIGLAAAALIGLLIFGYFYYNSKEKTGENANLIQETENTNQLIGGDTDEYGCLIAAGYSWCESKEKCLRVWEEECPEAEEATESSVEVEEEEEWLNYTSDKWQYAFKYPPEFALQIRSVLTGQDDPEGDNVVIWSNQNWRDLIPEATESIGDQFNISILPNKTLAEHEEELQAISVISTETVFLAGGEGVRKNYETFFGEISYLYFTGNNVPYVFGFNNVSQEDQFTVDKILASFRLMD